ncbi:MAG TPA: UDP-N-acetylmuramoyl-tripeptide--D-alanyl-D-alanine ligase [Candidatus Krumholzibacteria bacterium]|nr:UDP-N-acetylmuramoyl-tripeptide--D-alanyl-D-alanine ligase [Candidatus Krumholzibacteria bacterium]
MEIAVSVRTLTWVRDALAAAGELVRAELRGADATLWSGAVIDSRGECSGKLFFALPGEQTDGHHFVSNAFRAGCVALVVSDPASVKDEKTAPHFVVADTRRALTSLARAYRAHLSAHVVAITGSSGKTTTKEYTRAVLKTMYRVHANPGNLNSLAGVPLTILGADEDSEYLVCEVGANQRGEIDVLADLLRPDIAVITNIGDAHVGYFGSRDAIASEKGMLLRHFANGGHAVLPRDDSYFERLNAIVQGKVSSFGRSQGADFRLGDIAFVAGRLTFSVNDEPLALAAVGEYNAMNACAAFAVGEICGVSAARMRTAFAAVQATPGRGRVDTVAGVTVIDESYNASPSSMRKSIAMLGCLATPGRRIAVLGDMRELGSQSDELHRAVGAEAGERNIDKVYWLGEAGSIVRDAARAMRPSIAIDLHTAMPALIAAVTKDVRDGDIVLVKASRGTRLDEFVAGLLKSLYARG